MLLVWLTPLASTRDCAMRGPAIETLKDFGSAVGVSAPVPPNTFATKVQSPLKSFTPIWVTEYDAPLGRMIWAVLTEPVVLAVQESLPEEYESQSSDTEPSPPETSLLPALSSVQNVSFCEGLTDLVRVALAPHESTASRVTWKGDDKETVPRFTEYCFFIEEVCGYL